MSGSTKGKKGKQRNNTKKNATQTQSLMYEGSYANPRVAHAMLSLMGKNCQTKVRNGGIYEGLFHTFSQQMDLSLHVVHKLNSEVNGTDRQLSEPPKENDLVDKVVYKFDNVVSALFEDVDLEFAVQDVNETNGEMGNLSRGSKSFEKKLEPWDGGGDSSKADPLTIGGLESGIDGTNGWDASDMFKANEERYGVKSNYDSSLSSYTMALNIEEEKPENIARATKLAQEIENNCDYRHRIELEVDDGVTEEEKFSAVVRDREYRRDNRGPRESYDRERDNDHFGYRDRERGDRDRDQGMLPHRNHRDYNDKHRGRGARMRDVQPRHHQAYPPMGHSRSMGPGGPPGGDRRNPMSMPQMDGPTKFRTGPQNNIPPRFSKSGSGGHSREDERMKQNESNAMHSAASYQPPKGQRQPRINNRLQNNRPWSNSPSNDFMHNNPAQMHPDSSMIGVPQNGGGPNLSRTSSSSSNTSVPLQQGHRKHHSTSSQDDMPPHPTHHMRQSSQHSNSSPAGSPVMVTAQPPPPRPSPIPGAMPTPGQDGQPAASWASIARGKPAAVPPGDMTGSHMTQQSPQGLPQQSQVKNLIHVQEGATYTYTPPPSTIAYPMQASRGVNVPVQMATKSHNPQMVQNRGPQQQSILPRQQMQPQNIQPASNPQNHPQQQVSQQQPKMQMVGSVEQVKHAPKTEVSKAPKKADDPPTTPGSVNSTKVVTKELQEFYSNFKLSNEVKEPGSVSHPQNKASPRQLTSAPQQSLNMNNQQHAYQPHPTAPPRPEQVPLQAMGVSGGPAQIHPGQVSGPQQMKHPTPPNQGTVTHHNHQVTPAPISQQIPVASPSIQHFGSPSPQQSPMQGQPLMGGRMSADKANMLVMQKSVTSPKVENSYAPNPNVHVAVSQVAVAKPSAVYTVSAANPSPIASSHYQSPATQNAMSAHKSSRHSPAVMAGQVASPAPPMESASNMATSDIDSADAASLAGKPLNPEAQEFKPRAPAKPTAPAVAARTNTPVPQQQFVQQGQIMPPMPHIMASAPMYPGQLAQIDPMNPPQMPIYPPMFQQTAYLQTLQPIAGQQIPQFAFDQSGQVYHGPGQQAMMPPNARVAAMPPNQQQHVPQYPPDHGQPQQVFVPIAQQPQFIPQARPHSAHTPTQVAHATATSPPSQSIQQPPQVAHQQAMVQTQHPGGQQNLWIMSHMPQQQSVQQFITTVPSAHLPSSASMTNVTPQQQKGQHASVAYVTQQPPRQYAQYQSPPNT